MRKIILSYPDMFVEDYLSALIPESKFYYLIEEEATIYKKNITFNYSEMNEGEIFCVGADVLKHLFRTSGVTKFHGTKQKFLSKELGKEIEVGVLMDPSIINIYPHKEPDLLKGIKALVNYVEQDQNTKNYKLAKSVDEAVEILSYLRFNPSKQLIVDLETSGFYPHSSYILGVCLSTCPHEGFYIPWNFIPNLETLNDVINSFDIIVGHNFKFDYKFLTYNGVVFKDTMEFDDTMILYHCINENEAKGLKDLAIKFTDLGAYDAELDAEKKRYCKKFKIKVGDFSYAMLPSEVLGEYGLKDADATAQLYEKFKPKVTSQIYREMVKASLELAQVELGGAFINKHKALEAQVEFGKKIEDLYSTLTEIVSEYTNDLEVINFNANSPKQVGNILYNLLGYEVLTTTDSGAPSTSEEALEKLKMQYGESEFIDKLLEYRKANKFKSTYIDSILENLDTDSRIRTNFNVTGTTSGRLSSSGTINLQNIPSRDKTIKKFFTHEDPEWTYYQQDLGTAEVWVAAYLSKDPFLQSAFQSGTDFHSYIAKRVFSLDCPIDEVKAKYPEIRQAAKAITFGINI